MSNSKGALMDTTDYGRARRILSVIAVLVGSGACGGAEGQDEAVQSVQQMVRVVDPATPVASVGWVLKGTAVISGSAINLTPAIGSKAGTAFYPSSVDPTTLTVSFRSSITGAANNADGMTFVMADATRLAIPRTVSRPEPPSGSRSAVRSPPQGSTVIRRAGRWCCFLRTRTSRTIRRAMAIRAWCRSRS